MAARPGGKGVDPVQGRRRSIRTVLNNRLEQSMNRVHIQFERVQTWLFSAPRLRAMVGANVLLGEVLRVRLPHLAKKQDGWKLATVPEVFPAKLDDDPLIAHDDPAADARDGILSRDGGHFEACFESGARKFVVAARSVLHQELPGLRYRISIDGKEVSANAVKMSTDLPVLARCEWTGQGVASEKIQQGPELALVSSQAAQRHEAARKAEEGYAEDLATLLTATSRLAGYTRPQTLQDLAGDGYLALIHADGNSVGAAVKTETQDPERAKFFHRNRVLLRRALTNAIDQVCQDGGKAPLLLLMLGGDDVLVASRADVALPFLVSLCERLTEIQRNDDESFNLTLGVGIVFARPAIPIHHLHRVAEALAASAKRRYRGLPPLEGRSVVDWAVFSTTDIDEPGEMRRRDWIRESEDRIRILSRRPMDVLGAGLDSLQGLLTAASKLDVAPRSQLRYLVDQLPRGRMLSELAFVELSRDTRTALENAGVQTVWSCPDNGAPLMTSLLDLIEIYEIPRLGRAGTARPHTSNCTRGNDREEDLDAQE